MLVVGIIVSAIILISLLRFGVILEYDDGLKMWIKAGPFKIPMKSGDSPESPLDKILLFLEANKKKNNKRKRPKQSPPFKVILKAVSKIIRRIRRKLLIKQLIVKCAFADDDPVKVVSQYGIANSVFGVIVPALECNKMIKHYDLRASMDFSVFSPRIYVRLNISIAVWEVFYIASALFPLITAMLKPTGKKTEPAKNVCNQPT